MAGKLFMVKRIEQNVSVLYEQLKLTRFFKSKISFHRKKVSFR